MRSRFEERPPRVRSRANKLALERLARLPAGSDHVRKASRSRPWSQCGRHPAPSASSPPSRTAMTATAIEDVTRVRWSSPTSGVDKLETLSGGERRRAWLAMVLAQQTEVPAASTNPRTALDLRHQWELLDLIVRLNRDRGHARSCSRCTISNTRPSMAHRVAVMQPRSPLRRRARLEDVLTRGDASRRVRRVKSQRGAPR